jgi:hypothetical protein
MASSFTSFLDHTQRRSTSVGLLWTSYQPVAETSDNTQHSQQTDIHVTGGIRTPNVSRRAAADPRLRQRGYWDRLIIVLEDFIFHFFCLFTPPK